MSFISKLTLDGEEINVLHCRYHFSQETDATSRPTSIPKGGVIDVTIESNGKTDLFDWMISPTQTKSGAITFYRRDTMSQLKTIKFVDAHCIDYTEEYTHNGEYPMQITLRLSAKEVKLNDSSFKKNWPV
ncbi:type VI secretion system tube protein TssD [Niabella sp. CJ426]|jgi:hypothetical protein|uniref:type VI secretion system tube protein TssD n=1 Tax=Niabella TaxID=379899 RepID=UPI001F0FA720|nr:type VI secretion system tube protein TssD [Niabella hibiscisoli]MCH5721030.1 hypothetical protein [Niabella hibiscisoli]